MSAMGARELPGGRAPGGAPRWRELGTYLGLAVISVVMLYPFWSIGDRVVSVARAVHDRHGFSLSSWHQLFATLPVGRQLLSSAIVTVGAIAVILPRLSTTAGYALGVLRYRFSTVVFLFVISSDDGSDAVDDPAGVREPSHASASSTTTTAPSSSTRLLGTPFSTFLMTTYFPRRMPEDVVEASLNRRARLRGRSSCG